ncbi:ABC transporter ATP-binding protein (plasmid) [Agrobacterium radiobacter]|uniref:Putative sugar ABC transporter (ATP-binding protein), with TOBE domain (C-terminal) n=1 Tax=Agrobacterium tumefaciens str. B6 TaxID=1183423 RepID=A0A822VC07_AGRTU|nr:sn-glycerol-3-phosphate ABC transporter ATP-binding protein UgpC [Agrobacterium tumefaciens]KWT81239.1 ABC transporter ATP-binding protein [Agrobacterium tumefaciens str. B6]MQB27453.1 sn-glycerol-3-phosphate ABC transporter ATP-binding protein UgpC [Agrobacterium tumefaciens]NTA06046.1 sn-glycerol-3-phosphate ABC transporter ATP-binding protein UgpC [Agrobacterium tumefaciens]NTA95043.1 sn-glycerol-3-phosphate ABC transporter ATP-binding protein UgpC [Agrobacterium tumefaciens]NTB13692.1 s
MAMLSIDKITKAFGSLTVIPELSLTIEDGEFCVLVGPSGCGKSTLLRIIAGLEPISSGRVLVDGADMSDAEPPERGVAMVFQSYALYPHMNVARNIGFGLEIARTPAAEIGERVARATGKLKLSSYLKRKPRELSGGQRQRVAIGRAMTRKPKLFLLDEPLSNLDAALRVGMRVEIARLKAELGCTMIYVTHDQVEAMTLADKIVVMNGGRIEQIGSPLALYQRPANLFVAGFIGSPAMNLLKARVVAVAEGIATVSLATGPSLDIAVSRPLESGDTVTLGIRPEHIAIGDGQGGQSCPMKATMVELLGSDTFIHVREGEETITIRDSLGRMARAGDRVAVSFPAAACHLFDANGQRVSRDMKIAQETEAVRIN